ncbi:ATP-grasp domain-containing protein [Deferribacter thermophilus]|uniref:ATP-grasp domain-containing protein n=1 Tax=Deferribacter thermophilus TaxID=53573 RepID=UPI003C13ACDB
MEHILYTNFDYNPKKYYFVYIGELKSYGISVFFAEALSKLYPDKDIEFFAIVPDVFEQYDYENIIVINPVVEAYLKKSTNKRKISSRITAREFYTAVSHNDYVHSLIHKILENQDELYVYMFESSPYLTLIEHEKVKLIGPDPFLVEKFNNKIFQYTLLKDEIPVVEHKICNSFTQLIDETESLRNDWIDGIFVTLEYSAGGANSIISYTKKELYEKYKGFDTNYLISRYIPHKYDPTVLGVVGNENDIYIAGVADQRIVNGTKFTGSTYPSVLPEKVKEELYDYTRKIGKILGKYGYRGIFGCDYIVDDDENVFFVEINARKQGTTLEFCCTLENCLPEGSPNLPELELYSVLYNKFPENVIEKYDCDEIHWGTYNFKVPTNTITDGYIPQFKDEREVFRKVAKGKLKKDYVVMEHIGNDFIITTGTFLARIVSVASSREEMLEGIEFGKKLVENTIFIL